MSPTRIPLSLEMFVTLTWSFARDTMPRSLERTPAPTERERPTSTGKIHRLRQPAINTASDLAGTCSPESCEPNSPNVATNRATSRHLTRRVASFDTYTAERRHEMAAPMQMYLYVHEAILREVADLEARARDLNRDDPAEIGELRDRTTWFHEMAQTHEHAEEEILFPAMNERFRFVAETYAFDHDDFEVHVFDGITKAFTELARSEAKGARKNAARQLYRENVALHEHMRLHIAKENELLLPKVEQEFDIPEQAQIAGGMAGLFEPKLMGETVAWMYRGQTPQDREGMIRFLKFILPEEAFAGTTGMLSAADPQAWAETARRIPELNTE